MCATIIFANAPAVAALWEARSLTGFPPEELTPGALISVVSAVTNCLR